MNWQYNDKRDDNKDIIDVLVNQEGYIDLGWANSGKSFTHKKSITRELDCSIYSYCGTNYIYIDDTHKEILHVDMGD